MHTGERKKATVAVMPTTLGISRNSRRNSPFHGQSSLNLRCDVTVSEWITVQSAWILRKALLVSLKIGYLYLNLPI